MYPIRIVLGPHPGANNHPVIDAALKGGERTQALAEGHAQMHHEFRLAEPVSMYLDVTRSGAELGVVAGAGGTMWYEEAKAVRMPAREFAGRVYNDTGIRALKRSDAAVAARWFEKAEQTQPESALFAYNLACAYARNGSANAEAAVRRAIERGGAPIRERAAADADFASVRDAAWFRALVAP